MKKVKAVTPRLSDEDPDPLEQDDVEGTSMQLVEGWFPWEPEDMADIMKLIHEHMPPKPRQVLLAFLNGQSYKDIYVTEKYWRYYFAKGVEYIKKELGL